MTETMVGHFRVLAKLGQGGMGEVFLAEDTTLRRRVAIKRLSARLPDLPHWVARLRREAQALAAVNHPNVVTVYAVDEDDGVPFVVMELIEGRTLQQLLPSEGFELPHLLDLGIGIGEALEAAHAKGVLHRDLKPGNVMLTHDGRIKVVDFGLAKVLDEAAQGEKLTAVTTEGMMVGTVAYMAPEQLVGENADRRSDLYSFGVLLFEMATGRLPFAGTTVAWLMKQALLEPAPSLSAIRPGVPERLTRLVSALLAKEPQGRPASARLVIDELARCRRGEASSLGRARVLDTAPRAALTTTDMTVVRLLIRGRHLWNRRTEQSLRTALECFQEVIDRDPLQGQAWIGVADTLNLLSNYGFAPPGDGVVRVRAAVRRAIELEGESGEALRALALAAWQFEFDWQQADNLYRRALESDPGNALTHHWYGVLLGVTERFDQSLAQFAQAEAIDPLSLISLASRGWFTLFAGRPEEAHAILRRVLSLDSAYFPAYWFDGQALTVLGRHEEAVRSLTHAVEIGGRTSRMLGYLGHALARAGRTDEARGLLDELRERAEESYVPLYFPALILAGLDRRPEALHQLGRSLAGRDTMVRDLAVDTPWWTFREEPGYQSLLRQMGLRSDATQSGAPTS